MALAAAPTSFVGSPSASSPTTGSSRSTLPFTRRRLFNGDLGRRARHPRRRRIAGTGRRPRPFDGDDSGAEGLGRVARYDSRVDLRRWRAAKSRRASTSALSDRVGRSRGRTISIGWGQQVSPGVFSPLTFRNRPEVVAAFERLFEAQRSRPTSAAARSSSARTRSRCLKTVAVPCMAITGEHDQYAPPEAVTAFLAISAAGAARDDRRLRPSPVPGTARHVRGVGEVVPANVLDFPRYDHPPSPSLPWCSRSLMQTPASRARIHAALQRKRFHRLEAQQPRAFTIEDGAIVAKAVGMHGHAFYDGPLMNHTFRNFELKVDVMTRHNSNGGVFILTEFVEKGLPSKGLRDPGQQLLHEGQVKTGSLYHVSDIYETRRQRRRVVHRAHHRARRHHHDQGERQAVVQWTQPKDWAGGRGLREPRDQPGRSRSRRTIRTARSITRTSGSSRSSKR